MIHVWITPNECGPFAALEGVGAGTIAAGEERLVRPRPRLVTDGAPTTGGTDGTSVAHRGRL